MAMKLFHVPITHEYIQNLTDFDLEFIDMSSALDNPKFFEKMQNTFYDDEFDEYANEAEDEELTEEEKKMMEEIISKSNSEDDHPSVIEHDEFDDMDSEETENIDLNDPNEWEEVE